MRGRCSSSVVTGPLDERVRDRIVAETRGNPLALLELPRGLTPAELAGGFGLPDAPALSGRIEESFRRRLAPLPPATPAAAARRGGRAGRRSAAGVAGGRPRSAIDGRRGGAGDGGGPGRVRRAGALPPSARALGGLPGGGAGGAPARPPRARRGDRRRRRSRSPRLAPRAGDRRARRGRRRRARALGRPRAGARRPGGGGRLPRARRRADARARSAARSRALAAAQSKHQAGAPDAALRLLAMARGRAARRARAARARSCCARRSRSPSTRGRDAPPLLLAGGQAARAARRRRSRARPTSTRSPRRCSPTAWRAAATCARSPRRSSPPTGARRPASPRACDLLLDGLAVLTTEGYAAGAPALKRGAARVPRRADVRGGRAALAVARLPHRPGPGRRRELGRAHRRARSSSPAGPARSRCCPSPSTTASACELFAGELAAAAVAGRRGGRRRRGDRQPPRACAARSRWPPGAAGRPRPLALIEASRQDVLRRGEGLWLDRHRLGAARSSTTASAATTRRWPPPSGPPRTRTSSGISTWVLTELIEAAVRSGQPERAAGPLERLAEIAEANGTDWALGRRGALARAAQRGRGRRARSTARRSSGSAARRIRVALARAHLLYGEWLRRENRRVDAREQLRTAHEMLTEMGMDGVRRARPPRAAGHRRDGAQAHASRRSTT